LSTGVPPKLPAPVTPSLMVHGSLFVSACEQVARTSNWVSRYLLILANAA